MNQCDVFEDNLSEFVSDQLKDSVGLQMQSHLDSCDHCKKIYRETIALQDKVLAMDNQSVPEKAREEVLNYIHADLDRVGQFVGGMSMTKVLGAVGAGVGGVLLYMVILWGRVDFSVVPSHMLITVVGVWIGLMIAAFSWVLGKYKIRNMELNLPAIFGIITSGVAGIGILLCPQETYFAMWERSAISSSATEVFGPGASFALFGLVYALPLALMVATAMRPRPIRSMTGNAIVGASVSVILWIPAAYLQCSALAFSLLMAWAGGALIGLIGGFWGGVGLRRMIPVTH